MRLSARLGWLGLGATDDFVEAERRNYNLGTGVTAAADFCVAAKGCDYVSLIWRHYSVFNLNVIGSRVGRETWDVVEGQIEFPVWSRLGMGFEAEYCSRRFDLRDLPSGHRGLVEARAFVSWQF
jgi:hypothetical protein